MDTTGIGIFDLAHKRMAWAAQRQAILAKNIANANTPHFQPGDVADFAKTLAGSASIDPTRTHPNHLSGTDPGGARAMTRAGARPGARAGAHTPDGNGVALDRQLTKVADTETTLALTTNIFKKYMGLFGIALGKGG